MTIPAATPTFVQIPGNGFATNFAAPMKCFQSTDVLVGFIVGGTYAQQVSGFSITNVDSNGGFNVLFTVAPPLGTLVDIRTQTPLVQPTDFSNLGSYLPENSTECFDRLTRQTQDLSRLTYQFGVHGSDSESVLWPPLPAPSQRAGGALVFDNNGLPEIGVPVPGTISTSILAPFLGLSQTPAEAAAGVVPVNLAYAPGNVLRYGARGDGSIDNAVVLTAASSIGTSLYFPFGTFVSSNLTISVPCSFDSGAILKPTSGKTITINAPVTAGPWQIFDETSGGIISGLIRPVNADGRMYFEWWGAKGDNATNDAGSLQSALRAAATANFIGIQMLAKQYKTLTPLNANVLGGFNAPSIYGVDPHLSQLTTTAPIVILEYKGGSGTTTGAVVENVGFIGMATASTGLQLNGQCGVRARRCLFDQLQTGVTFTNGVAGSFSEFNVLDNCEWSFNVTVAYQYIVGAGSNSFHGCGMLKGLITSNITTPAIIIGAGARPYGAPLDGQMFYANNSAVIANNSSVPVDFYGSLNTENLGGGTLTLATGGVVPFTGSINCSGQTVVGGTFLQMQAMITNQDTVQTFLGGRKAYQTPITTGANVLPSMFFNQHRLAFLRLVAANYDYRYLLSVDQDGAGIPGYVTIIATVKAFNVAGYGAPAFTVNNAGMLVATNGGWPSSGVICYWSESCISFGNETLEVAQF